MTYREVLETMTRGTNTSSNKAAAVNSNNENTGAAGRNVNTAEIVDGTRAFSKKPCPPLPGTILRISIPAGTAINLLNLVEVASPGGICIIVRLPFLGTLNPEAFGSSPIMGILDAIKAAGGRIEVVG